MEREKTPLPTHDQVPSGDDGRREFLKKCGKFAAITPPAVTMLLSTSLTSGAIAKSGSGSGGYSGGHPGGYSGHVPPGQAKKDEYKGPPGQTKKYAESGGGGGGPPGQAKKNK